MKTIEFVPDRRNDAYMHCAEQIIEKLGLEPMEGESGLFYVMRRSGVEVKTSEGRALQACNSLYYFLGSETPCNYLHRHESDDIVVVASGGPAWYYCFHGDGRAERTLVGSDLAKGEQPMFHVPANTWKAIRLDDAADFVLFGNVCAPGWTLDRCEIGAGQEFVDRFTGAAEWATGAFLRELIGPNWKG